LRARVQLFIRMALLDLPQQVFQKEAERKGVLQMFVFVFVCSPLGVKCQDIASRPETASILAKRDGRTDA